MLDRIVAGRVPAKHHIVFNDDHGGLLYEECLTRRGFDGAYTILYHQHRPHESSLQEAGHGWAAPAAVAPAPPLARRHFRSPQLGLRGGPPVDNRQILMFNADIEVGLSFPDAPDPVYVTNGDGDQLLFIQEGGGLLRSPMGDLRFEALDYVVIPRGLIHRLLPDAGRPQTWLTMEFPGGVGLPKQWRNEVGQIRMDAPFCHRDFRRSEFLGPVDEGIRRSVVKQGGRWHGFGLTHSPLDVVGWDGAVYPWVFPILNFQPRAGLVHLPPDWHGTFATPGALVCSFVPRVVDFHPQAIPCPYPHSSVDCDELIFYSQGNFTSRRGVGPGGISFHPAGIPHGPHPGAYEASVGSGRADEIAVMVDTFRPLSMTSHAAGVEDLRYHDSFTA